MAEREPGGDDRLYGRTRTDAQRPFVAERADTAGCAERAIEQRRVYDADDRHAVFDEAHRYADRVEAVQEVGGAVERIDEPTRLEVVAPGFLTEDRQPRVSREQLADRLLTREVGFAHPVARRLLPHLLETTEVPAHDIAARAKAYELAARMQLSAPEVVDFSAERERQQLAVVEGTHASAAVIASASSGVPAATS